MEDRKFYTVLFIVLGVCALFTVAHFIYAAQAYQQCSIIAFIAKELW